MVRALPAAYGVFALVITAASLQAQSLAGSSTAMQRQHLIAKQHDYTFLRRPADVQRFVRLGLLVPIRGNGHYALAGVSHPYGRPALRTFVQRLAAQYHAACGEKLVVTSLTRPLSDQPRNASDLSVHPAGMAVDLRASKNAKCRAWLERTLLSLEKQGVLDATRERFPPHYHVALYPQPYLRYVDALTTRNAPRVAAAPAARTERVADATPTDGAVSEYVVNAGDTLWSLARRYGTSVEQLKQINNLSSARIAAGQVLTVPADQQ